MELKVLLVVVLVTGYIQLFTDALPLCECEKTYIPVCGEDGVTYGNLCDMECANATLAHEGECGSTPAVVKRQVEGQCSCSFEINQVCGSDGNTYLNPCLLACANVVEVACDQTTASTGQLAG